MTGPALPTATSELELERYLLRELPAEMQRHLADRLEADPALRARVAALGRSDAELGPAWSAALARDVRARLRSRQAAPLRRFAVPSRLLVVAAASALLALQGPLLPRTDGLRPDGDLVTLKGSRPRLALFRKTISGSEALEQGALARKGDWIRVGYRAAGRHYGMILSVDGRGAVTWHLPLGGGAAVPLASSETTLLDGAYELDDAPGFERFYFVTAEQPFDSEAALFLARSQGAGVEGSAEPHLRGLDRSVFALRKEAR